MIITNRKVSIIVPIYNTAEYLPKCLESILNQSYTNLEIILVNDGSTDSSGAIIDEYAKKDDRIIVLHKQNGGIGSAYKVALMKVTGAYVSFVDSDDYIDLDMYKKLIEVVDNNNYPDIVHFGYALINNNGMIIDRNWTLNEIVEGNSNILIKHFTSIRNPSLACRLFKSSLFTGVTILDQNIGIDEILLLQLLVKCNKVVHISNCYYYAYIRATSVSRIKYSKRKVFEGIMVHRFICTIFNDSRTEILPYIYLKYLGYLFTVYCKIRLDKVFMGSEELNYVINDIVIYYPKAKRYTEYKQKSIIYRSLAHLIFLHCKYQNIKRK